MSGFQVGDVVVCVDASPCRRFPYPGAPFWIPLNSIWRVERRWVSRLGIDTIALCNAENKGNGWTGYNSNRFRKIDAPKSIIADRIRACKPHRVPA